MKEMGEDTDETSMKALKVRPPFTRTGSGDYLTALKKWLFCTGRAGQLQVRR